MNKNSNEITTDTIINRYEKKSEKLGISLFCIYLAKTKTVSKENPYIDIFMDVTKSTIKTNADSHIIL